MNKERGSISLFVIVSCLFLLLLVLVIVFNINNKKANQELILNQIVKEYEHDNNEIESEYQNLVDK